MKVEVSMEGTVAEHRERAISMLCWYSTYKAEFEIGYIGDNRVSMNILRFSKRGQVRTTLSSKIPIAIKIKRGPVSCRNKMLSIYSNGANSLFCNFTPSMNDDLTEALRRFGEALADMLEQIANETYVSGTDADTIRAKAREYRKKAAELEKSIDNSKLVLEQEIEWEIEN